MQAASLDKPVKEVGLQGRSLGDCFAPPNLNLPFQQCQTKSIQDFGPNLGVFGPPAMQQYGRQLCLHELYQTGVADERRKEELHPKPAPKAEEGNVMTWGVHRRNPIS